MKALSTAGTFKCAVESWGIDKADSGAIGVSMQLRITDEWDATEKKWVTWMADAHGVALEPFVCYCSVWIFKKDKSESHNGIEQLVSALGWGGDLTFFAPSNPPKDVSIIVDVKEETYQGKKQYKGGWIYPITHNPADRGGLRNVASDDDIRKLQEEMGARLRAAVPVKK